ncbi:hypothetical protein OG259_00220 [Streptomyces sp. NBC_00250]|uniref:hypothetical protein n=1 Tax=Streptomyces sp. NBC_00250 TaxID=2903641 RepID=UPI002E2BB3F9|nr:hypothetical protein [Streptomyces sp. NBC_00250]
MNVHGHSISRGGGPNAEIATSALDAAAEQRVFDQIHRLADKGQTTVLITDALAGHVTNTAKATGTDPDGSAVESPSVRLRIPAVCPPDGYGYGGCKNGDHGYGDNGYGDNRDKTGRRPGNEAAR